MINKGVSLEDYKGTSIMKGFLKAISKREDVSEADKKAAVKEYGEVTYADTKNKKYPIDTESHVRAAASYFGMEKNRSKYSAEEQKAIDSKIKAAEKKFGIGKAVADGDMFYKGRKCSEKMRS